MVIDEYGIDAPEGWARGWPQALAEAGDRRVNVTVFGDSIGEGYYASDRYATSWWAIWRDHLQARFGHGGSGFLSVAGAPAAALPPFPIAETGTWTADRSAGTNVSLRASDPDATLTFGALTRAVRGQYIDVWYQPVAAPGSLVVRSDLGTALLEAGAQEPGMGGAVQVARGVLDEPDHERQVTVEVTGADTTIAINGIDGRNDRGCAVHNLAVAGQPSNLVNEPAWSGAPVGEDIGRYAITRFMAPDLFVYCMFANDMNYGVPEGTALVNGRRTLDLVLARNPGCAIVVMIIHPSLHPDVAAWPQYVAALYTLAREYGAAVIDYWERGGTTTDYLAAEGLHPAVDDPHPTDRGQAWHAESMIELTVNRIDVPSVAR